jgi:leucyl-tRNA synthetase
MSEEPTKEMQNLTLVAPPASKGTAKRDALRANEVVVQEKWASAKAFESDPVEGQESFMVTFPYPYSNGHLHIGHAFSLTKAVFRAQYERHRGKNVLFPFAFHCTGMPIQAVRIVCENPKRRRAARMGKQIMNLIFSRLFCA